MSWTVFLCIKGNKFFIVLASCADRARSQLELINEYDYLCTPMRGVVAEINLNQTITYSVRV